MLRTKPDGGAISLCHLEVALLLCRTETVAEIKEDLKKCLRSTQHKPHSIPCLLGDLGLLTQALLNLSNRRDRCCRIRGWIHLPTFNIIQCPAHKPGVEMGTCLAMVLFLNTESSESLCGGWPPLDLHGDHLEESLTSPIEERKQNCRFIRR